MADKETIVCSVSDGLLHKLSRYELREGLKQTHVYERAMDFFITWYDSQTPSSLKDWRVLASAQGGRPYRGRIPSSQKARLQEIAAELRHPFLDVVYTALSMLIDAESIEQTQLVNCFLDQSLFERLEQEVESHYEDRSAFVEAACKTYLNWYDGKERPPHYTIPVSQYTGRPYEAYVSLPVHQRLEELARQAALSVVDVYHEVLLRQDQGAGEEQGVMVTALLPKGTAKQVNQYIKDCDMKEGDFLEQALKHFLKWYTKSAPEEWEPYPASIGGERVQGYVPIKVVEKIHKLPFPRLDLYAHATRYYAHTRDIDPSPFLFSQVDEAQTATNGMAKIKLLPEQEKLIRLLLVVKDMRTINEFCNEAAKWWLERRRRMDPGEEEYFSRLSPATKEEEDELVDVHLSTPYALHSAMQAYAHEDSQSLRTVYYNAVIRYLDHIADFEDLSNFIDKMK